MIPYHITLNHLNRTKKLAEAKVYAEQEINKYRKEFEARFEEQAAKVTYLLDWFWNILLLFIIGLVRFHSWFEN